MLIDCVNKYTDASAATSPLSANPPPESSILIVNICMHIQYTMNQYAPSAIIGDKDL